MLGMVLLIGLVSGVVLVAAAGAWRTSTTYPRLLANLMAAGAAGTTVAVVLTPFAPGRKPWPNGRQWGDGIGRWMAVLPR